jgi:putative transposase
VRQFIYPTVEVKKRRRLPHWYVPGGLYFVTFRLEDALTKSVEEVIQEEAYIKYGNLKLPQDEIARLVAREVAINVDRELDGGMGSNLLLAPDAANEIIRCTEFRDGVDYLLIASTVMSNHAHIVFKLLDATISDVLQQWKSVSARRINHLLGRSGVLWQEDYYDVLIRDDEHLTRAIKYTVNNPLKIGRDGEFTRMYPENMRALDLELVGSLWQMKAS